MKAILKSIALVSALSVVVIGATTAYFSDTETSAGNTIAAGTINLTVDGQDPLRKALVTLKDMKPSTWFAVQTPVVVTDNPADLYKHYVAPVVCEDGIQTEPECEGLRGVWNSEDKICTYTQENPSKDDLDKSTTIDLAICWDWDGDGNVEKELDEFGTPKPWVDSNVDGAVNPGEGSECDVIIPGDLHKKLGDVLSQKIPLIRNATPGKTYIVHQSFHLQGEVTNWAQGDQCTFSEEFIANQAGQTLD